MSAITQRITPFLWFDRQAEDAVELYTAVFSDSHIDKVVRYGREGAAVSGMPEGSVMTIAFQLDGQEFVAINGGPHFTFTEAVSFVVNCENQQEIDYYWGRLSEGGDPAAQQCGWLKDRYGLSWQVVPVKLPELLADPDPVKAQRVAQAMFQMKKIDFDRLECLHAE